METRKLSVPLGGPGLEGLLREELGVPPEQDLPPYTLLRRSLDARHKDNIRILYSVRIDESPAPEPAYPAPTDTAPVAPRRRIGREPVVVGTGPAGLFAARALVEKGYRPLVIERGQPLARRVTDVARLRSRGLLEPGSNILFGEGGAGTFSDGKLTHRSRHHLVDRVFAALVEAGAPPEIRYEQKPHIGTDRLRGVVARLRRQVEDGGGRFLFGVPMEEIEIDDGALRAVRVGGDRYETDTLFLGTGHSARDTYRMLWDRGVELAPRPFAVGVRIEHEQELIDRAQFGRWAGHPELGAGDYRLAWTDPTTGRGVWSFCNCPGGLIVPAMHEPGTVNTNGMSRYARDSGLSNSAIVVTVTVDDFFRGSPVDGLAYQREIEERAFRRGGGDFRAPAQNTRDFLIGRASRKVTGSSYGPGVVPEDLSRVLPEHVVQGLGRAIPVFSRRIRGFERSVLVGPETRTSAPVRILRDRDTMESVNVGGLFPIGEGSGYSGGIVSSAVDALRAVERIEAIHG